MRRHFGDYMKIKAIFEGKLSAEELAILPTSFDTVGDIIIFNEFPSELKKQEAFIGKTLLSTYPYIKVIAKKSGQYSGDFRTPEIKVIAGEKRKVALHKENGVRLRVDVEKTYFSARTATERERITKLVKPNEEVLVMFSGVGPLAVQISKHTKATSVVGVEINPSAHELAKENALLNKCKNTTFYLGDVNTKIPKSNKFDRIIMPLPKTAEEFLPLAIKHIKSGGVIHLYMFDALENIPSIKKRIKTAFPKVTLRFLRVVKAGQYSPGYYRLCFDIKASFK